MSNKTKLEYPIVCEAEICDPTTIDKDKLAAAGIKDIDADLMPVKFKLVHANTNKNKDTFTKEDLKASELTPKYKPIDWQHTDRLIGVMLDSSYNEGSFEEASGESTEDDYLEIDGVIYKYKFPAYATEMTQRHEEGNLLFSMEVWFEEAECSVCGGKYAQSSDYCEHLKGRMLEGSTASRVLRGLTFGGAGVVEKPADEDASSVSLGEKNKNIKPEEDEDMPKKNEGQIVFDSENELNDYIQAEVTKALDKVKDEEGYKALKKDLETATEKIVTLEKVIEDKDKEVGEANTKVSDSEKEFADFKEELEKDKKTDERVSDLIEAGINLPEEDEKKEKIVASIRKMSDEEYTQYKEMILTSIASSKTEAEEETEETSTEAEAATDVPNPSNADEEVSALRAILNKTSK